MAELAEGILRKIMEDGARMGYVDAETGVIDVRVNFTDQESAYLESLRPEEG